MLPTNPPAGWFVSVSNKVIPHKKRSHKVNIYQPGFREVQGELAGGNRVVMISYV